MFRLASPSNFIKKFDTLRFTKQAIQSQSKRFVSYNKANSNYTNFARVRTATRETPNMALTFLGVLGVSSLYLAAHKPILNETGFANGPILIDTKKGAVNLDQEIKQSQYDGAFDGKLNYRQVAIGSIAGLVLGYALSRLSSILFVVSIGLYCLNVYLRRQGIVAVDTKKVFKGAVDSVSWDELVFEKASFSVPFVLSFFTAASL